MQILSVPMRFWEQGGIYMEVPLETSAYREWGGGGGCSKTGEKICQDQIFVTK